MTMTGITGEVVMTSLIDTLIIVISGVVGLAGNAYSSLFCCLN